MKHTRTSLAALATLAGLGLAMPAAHAQSHLYINGDLRGTGASDRNTLLDGTTPLSASDTLTGGIGANTDESDFRAAADYGTLHGYGHASANGIAVQATGEALSQFTDTLHVTSSTLVTGTPVSLTFTLPIDGSLSATSDGLYDIAVLHASFGASNGNGTSGTLSYNDSTSATYPTNGHQQDGPLTLIFAVGNTVTIGGALDVYGIVSTDAANPSVQATADYSNTAHFYVASQTPGVTLTSASGHDYSAPASAPEPSPALALAIGLLGLGALVVKAKKRTAAFQ